MATIELAQGCQRWATGEATKHPPHDASFLKAVARAGFTAFTGPAGLCGGKSDTRTVLAIHRGRGARWEIIFREKETDVVATSTNDLDQMTPTLLAWLRGDSLSANEDSIYASPAQTRENR